MLKNGENSNSISYLNDIEYFFWDRIHLHHNIAAFFFNVRTLQKATVRVIISTILAWTLTFSTSQCMTNLAWTVSITQTITMIFALMPTNSVVSIQNTIAPNLLNNAYQLCLDNMSPDFGVTRLISDTNVFFKLQDKISSMK